MQDVQVARHDPHQGQPSLFHDLRVLRFNSLGAGHQEWISSCEFSPLYKDERLLLAISTWLIFSSLLLGAPLLPSLLPQQTGKRRAMRAAQ